MLETTKERQVLFASDSSVLDALMVISAGTSMLMKHFYTIVLSVLVAILISVLAPEGIEYMPSEEKVGAAIFITSSALFFIGAAVIVSVNSVYAMKLRGVVRQLMMREHDPEHMAALVNLARYASFAGLYVIISNLITLVPAFLALGGVLLVPVLGLQDDWALVMVGLMAMCWLFLVCNLVMLAATAYGAIIAFKVNAMRKKFTTLCKEVEVA
jgi:hypothetical protein